MTYEKAEQRKKAQMNLENCRYYRFWQLNATLDSTKKNCCRCITDGEELRNSQNSFRHLQQCSSSFSCHQGQAAMRWLVLVTSGLESRNSRSLRFAGFEWSVGQER